MASPVNASWLELWRSWSYNHTPAHIQYFTRDSFEKAAAAAGLEVVFWDAGHEDGQAFEGWRREAPLTLPGNRRPR